MTGKRWSKDGIFGFEEEEFTLILGCVNVEC
jgi:hypothetical protein